MAPVGPALTAPHLDKLLHLCEYLLFAWLLVQGMWVSDVRGRAALQRAWLIATSYGALIELLQGLVPWRTADGIDALVNGLGAALGASLGSRVRRW